MIMVYDQNSTKLLHRLVGEWDNQKKVFANALIYDEQKKYLYSLAFSLNDFARLNIWDLEKEKIIESLELPSFFHNPILKLSKDGKILVIANSDGTVMMSIDVETKDKHLFRHNEIIPAEIVDLQIVKEKNDYLISLYDKNLNLRIYSLKENRLRSIEKYENISPSKQDFDHNYFLKEIVRKRNTINNICYENRHLEFVLGGETHHFNLNKLDLYKGNSTLYCDKKSNGGYKVSLLNKNTKIEISKEGKHIFDFSFMKSKIRHYRIVDNRWLILTTDDIMLMPIIDLKEKRVIANMQGFLSPQNTEITYDGNFLITAGESNNINLYKINKKTLKNLSQDKPSVNQDFLKLILKAWNLPETYGEDLLKIIGGDYHIPDFILKEFASKYDLSSVPTEKEFKDFLALMVYKYKKIFPTLHLFVQDNEWIAYRTLRKILPNIQKPLFPTSLT